MSAGMRCSTATENRGPGWRKGAARSFQGFVDKYAGNPVNPLGSWPGPTHGLGKLLLLAGGGMPRRSRAPTARRFGLSFERGLAAESQTWPNLRREIGAKSYSALGWGPPSRADCEKQAPAFPFWGHLAVAGASFFPRDLQAAPARAVRPCEQAGGPTSQRPTDRLSGGRSSTDSPLGR